YQEPLGNLSAHAQLTSDVVTIDQLRLDKAPGQTLTATGSYDLNTKSYQISADGKNLELTNLTLPGALPVRGVVSLTAQGQGTEENPNLTAKIVADKLQVREDDLGSITANANVAGKLANVDVTAPKYNLVATAAIGTTDPYPTQFQITAKGTDLAKLPIKLEEPLVGTVTAQVQ